MNAAHPADCGCSECVFFGRDDECVHDLSEGFVQTVRLPSGEIADEHRCRHCLSVIPVLRASPSAGAQSGRGDA